MDYIRLLCIKGNKRLKTLLGGPGLASHMSDKRINMLALLTLALFRVPSHADLAE